MTMGLGRLGAGFGRLGTFGGRGLGPLAALFAAAASTSGYYPVFPGYVFKDTAGTDPCTADGDLIKCFKPQYGSLPNVTQGTDSLCPIYKDDGGGKWRADWDGLDDTALSATSLTVDLQNFIAVAMQRATNQAGIAMAVQANSTNYHRITTVSTAARINGAVRSTAGGLFTTAAANNDDPLNTPVVKSSLFVAGVVDNANDLTVKSTVGSVVFTAVTSAQIALVPPALSTWGFSVYRAATIPATARDTIVKALAALQGRTL